MKWKKLGQVFDPTTYNDGFSRDFMKTHSQCTSVIELDNCLRVFFSCRPLNDKDGQAKSYTTFLDLDKENLFSILNFPSISICLFLLILSEPSDIKFP